MNVTSILSEEEVTEEEVNVVEALLHEVEKRFMVVKSGLYSESDLLSYDASVELSDACYSFAFLCCYSTIKKLHSIGGEEDAKTEKRKEGASNATLLMLDTLRREVRNGQSIVEAIMRYDIPAYKKALDFDCTQEVVCAVLAECEKSYKRSGGVDLLEVYEVKTPKTLYIRRASDLEKLRKNDIPIEYKISTTTGSRKAFKAVRSLIEANRGLMINVNKKVCIDYSGDTSVGENGDARKIYLTHKIFSVLTGKAEYVGSGNFGNTGIIAEGEADEERASDWLEWYELFFEGARATTIEKKIIEYIAYGITEEEARKLRVPDREARAKAMDKKGKKATRGLTEREVSYVTEDVYHNDNLSYDQIAVLLQITQPAVAEHVTNFRRKVNEMYLY